MAGGGEGEEEGCVEREKLKNRTLKKFVSRVNLGQL